MSIRNAISSMELVRVLRNLGDGGQVEFSTPNMGLIDYQSIAICLLDMISQNFPENREDIDFPYIDNWVDSRLNKLFDVISEDDIEGLTFALKKLFRVACDYRYATPSDKFNVTPCTGLSLDYVVNFVGDCIRPNCSNKSHYPKWHIFNLYREGSLWVDTLEPIPMSLWCHSNKSLIAPNVIGEVRTIKIIRSFVSSFCSMFNIPFNKGIYNRFENGTKDIRWWNSTNRTPDNEGKLKPFYVSSSTVKFPIHCSSFMDWNCTHKDWDKGDFGDAGACIFHDGCNYPQQEAIEKEGGSIRLYRSSEEVIERIKEDNYIEDINGSGFARFLFLPLQSHKGVGFFNWYAKDTFPILRESSIGCEYGTKTHMMELVLDAMLTNKYGSEWKQSHKLEYASSMRFYTEYGYINPGGGIVLCPVDEFIPSCVKLLSIKGYYPEEKEYCRRCNTLYNVSDMVEIDDNYYCSDCHCVCDDCGEDTPTDRTHDVEGDCVCYHCIDNGDYCSIDGEVYRSDSCTTCEDCDDCILIDDAITITMERRDRTVCRSCSNDDDYISIDGDYYHIDMVEKVADSDGNEEYQLKGEQ
jgi:hypothetical protein